LAERADGVDAIATVVVPRAMNSRRRGDCGLNAAMDGAARGWDVATRPRRCGESRRLAHLATTSMRALWCG